MTLESRLFIQELAGHLKHQKIKQTRFRKATYVTRPANLRVERQQKSAQNKPQPSGIWFLLETASPRGVVLSSCWHTAQPEPRVPVG